MTFRHFYASRQLPTLRQVKELVPIPRVLKTFYVLHYSAINCPVGLHKVHKTHTRVFVKVAVLIKSSFISFKSEIW